MAQFVEAEMGTQFVEAEIAEPTSKSNKKSKSTTKKNKSTTEKSKSTTKKNKSTTDTGLSASRKCVHSRAYHKTLVALRKEVVAQKEAGLPHMEDETCRERAQAAGAQALEAAGFE
jgi:hypothetical protein